MSEFLDYEDIVPELYYAITINNNGIITGRHESKEPISSLQFYENPWLHGDIVRGVSEASEHTEGVHIDCYDDAGKYKGHVWAIENGYIELPVGYEIVDGELVEVDKPIDESTPPTIKDRLNPLDAENDKDRRINTIVFRALAQTDVISATDALDNAAVFQAWAERVSTDAKVGEYLRYEGGLYRVKQAHKIRVQYPPSTATAALYSKVTMPGEIPDWSPGSWAKDIKVRHKGRLWLSMVENNTWEPGAPGVYDNIWKEVV